MENSYIIKFDNKIPTLESLKYENSGNNHSYPTITIDMKVYKKDILIHAVILHLCTQWWKVKVFKYKY